jgi:hypothetical protein
MRLAGEQRGWGAGCPHPGRLLLTRSPGYTRHRDGRVIAAVRPEPWFPPKSGRTMAGEQNLVTAKRAHAEFSEGDVEGAMAIIADDVVWITPGNSAISGTLRSKHDLAAGGPAGRAAVQDLATVLVLRRGPSRCPDSDHGRRRGGRFCRRAHISGRKLIRFQTARDTAMLERAFGSK